MEWLNNVATADILISVVALILGMVFLHSKKKELSNAFLSFSIPVLGIAIVFNTTNHTGWNNGILIFIVCGLPIVILCVAIGMYIYNKKARV